MEREAWSGLARPLAWSAPSNRAAIVISAGTALTRRHGLWPAAEAFATWALARELAPDFPPLAVVAAAVDALRSRRPAVAAAARERTVTRGLLATAARIATRSTGRAPTPLDRAALGLGAVLGPRTRRGRAAALLVGAALAYDWLRPRPHGRLRRRSRLARADTGRPLNRFGLTLARAAALALTLV